MEHLTFIHCADIHLDAPFKENGRNNYGEARRKDIRAAFSNIIDSVKKKNADMLLIAGDLFEHRTVTRGTLDWLYMKLSETAVPVVIIPGNHDPYLINSWYKSFEWPDNVIILSPDKPHVLLEKEGASIAGLGFSSFKEEKADLGKIPSPKNGFFNILMLHGTCDMDFTNSLYNPVNSNELEALGYDYYALGHFHAKRNDYSLKTVFNPGSPEPLGFDETGEHGAFYVSMKKEQGKIQLETEWFNTSIREYQHRILDVTGCKTLEEVKIRILGILEGLDPDRVLIKVTLKGRTDLGLDEDVLTSDFSDQWLFLEICNETRKEFDLDAMIRDQSLKGAFVREMKLRLHEISKAMMEDRENTDLKKQEEILMNALYYGLDALQNGKIEWLNEL